MSEVVVEIEAPDIERFRRGNTGIPFATALESGRPGPNVLITALTHGNELSGAHALVRLFETDVRPARGQLTLAFVNTDAYARFDPANPRATRYLDEDLNRVWSPDTLDGGRRSRELERARQLRPLIEAADYLLDLHSMQLPSPPLLLVGLHEKGRRLARRMGFPGTVVADEGHRNGVRMRDHGRFGRADDPATAILVECGQHWARTSVDVAILTCRQFLQALDLVPAAALDRLAPAPPPVEQRVVEVTEAVTVERGPFRFVDAYQGLEVVAEAGTVIAHDGDRPVTTPYDGCVLIMPSQRLATGLTAVRLGRQVA
ncbi:MAG TPA: succinylglutamate desuccinylase/aspartoacylase family protein [Geminicoccaceae bacterium]